MLCTLDYSFRRHWGPRELDSAHCLLCKHTGPHLLKVCTCVTTHLLTGPTKDCVCQQMQWDHWARSPSWICPTSAGDQKVVGGVSANVCISSWNVIYLSWMCPGCLCSIFSTCAELGTNALWPERGSDARWQREKLRARATISGRSEANTVEVYRLHGEGR